MRLTDASEGTALGPVGFDRLMAPLGPFEPAPILAVALSGGADSMALALLADQWARARGGGVVTLTVDHGLRPGSDAEAARVGAWMAARGIDHRIVTWRGDKPTSGIQEAARAARHRLLAECCRALGVLHLLLAHHRGDQAETVAMRTARGSGPDGLSGMPAVRELAAVRLLRPLLPVGKADLIATCRAFDAPWIEDPSNQRMEFARVRIRSSLDAGQAAALVRSAVAAGEARAELDEAAAMLLVEAASLHGEGWAELVAAPFLAAPEPVARRVLGRLLVAIGGSAHPPRSERLDRLLAELRGGAGGRAVRSLGGCLIAPGRAGWRITREPAAVAGPVPLAQALESGWDGRFAFQWQGGGKPDPDLVVGALGAVPSAQVDLAGLPAAVRRSLPALWRDGRLAGLPHLGCVADVPAHLPCHAVFRPPEPVAGPRFSVV